MRTCCRPWGSRVTSGRFCDHPAALSAYPPLASHAKTISGWLEKFTGGAGPVWCPRSAPGGRPFVRSCADGAPLAWRGGLGRGTRKAAWSGPWRPSPGRVGERAGTSLRGKESVSSVVGSAHRNVTPFEREIMDFKACHSLIMLIPFS